MSPYLLALVSAAYLYTAVEQAVVANPWWFGVWASYAVANLCLIKAMAG